MIRITLTLKAGTRPGSRMCARLAVLLIQLAARLISIQMETETVNDVPCDALGCKD